MAVTRNNLCCEFLHLKPQFVCNFLFELQWQCRRSPNSATELTRLNISSSIFKAFQVPVKFLNKTCDLKSKSCDLSKNSVSTSRTDCFLVQFCHFDKFAFQRIDF